MISVKKLRYLDCSFFAKYSKLDISKFYLIEKEKVAFGLFCLAMLLAFFASLRVWFLWSFRDSFPFFCIVLLVPSMLISNSMEKPLFTRKDFLLSVIAFGIILFYQTVLQSDSFIPFVMTFMRLFIFFALFRLSPCYYERFATVICKVLAVLIGLSLFMFFLFHLGLNLPSRNDIFDDTYSFTNYYFFLIRDWAEVGFQIPRFHAVFLEPGHMGTTIILLLATQISKWTRWYNIILIVALVFSFSLAAYGLMTILVFLHMWIKRKKILPKIIAVVSFIAVLVGGSFLYKGGDNMFNQLIVMRLQVKDSGDDIEGNNRVSPRFQTEFDSYVQSSDIFFGRKVNPDIMHGNAGYKVYIYTYGIVGFILCYLSYIIAMYKAPDKRAFIAMLILSLANFWIRAYPFWFGFFISYYLFAMLPTPYILKQKLHYAK